MTVNFGYDSLFSCIRSLSYLHEGTNFEIDLFCNHFGLFMQKLQKVFVDIKIGNFLWMQRPNVSSHLVVLEYQLYQAVLSDDSLELL